MIVRDAADFITETLQLALPFIDTWMIVDTGSIDDTRSIVQQFFASKGITGTLVERPWISFAHNRTEALQLATGVADFAFMLDADDLVIGKPLVREAVSQHTHPSYYVKFGTTYVFWRPAVFDLSFTWEFRGAVHEYAVCLDSDIGHGYIEGEYHFVYQSLGGRSKDPERFLRDIKALENELATDPTNSRTVFYLGQSNRDAGLIEKAIFYYKMRTQMDGWIEEKYIAALELARLLELSDADTNEVISAYEYAHSVRPIRAEALYGLARFHRIGERWADGHSAALRIENLNEPDDLLFVEPEIYSWKLADEIALCAFYLRDFRQSLRINEQLLWNPALPLEERDRILSNKAFSLQYLGDSYADIPQSALSNGKSELPLIEKVPEVTLTITTCRRRELFERTIDSFLSTCTDLHLIKRWICIDDGSSDFDRQLMQDRYPFFEFIFKSSSEAGHVHSMNRLLYEVRTTHWLHLEDDWEFTTQGPHISRAILVLNDDESLVQVVLNKNYAESTDHWNLVGGEIHVTKSAIPYRTHTYLPHNSVGLTQLLSENPGRLTNAHWPGFSLMPSLIHRQRIAAGGAFNPGSGHFEREMAERLHVLQFRTAFFDDLIMLNIGKMRSDSSENAPQNAYALNNVTQFRDFSVTPIQIHTNWSESNSITKLWSRHFCNAQPWFGASLDVENNSAERHLIVNMPTVSQKSIGKDSYLVHMEPNEGIRNFGPWAEPNPTEFAHFRSRRVAMNPFEWHLNCTFDELVSTSPVKTRDLSTVVSSKRMSVGHHLRLDFIHNLQEQGIPIDVWGRDLESEFSMQLGPLPDLDKRKGLFPYRYTIAVENNSEPNYATEKIVDGILSECLTFYWGCPNLCELIDEEAFIRLPLEDMDRSVEIIRAAIANNEYGRRLPAIQKAKREILNKHHIAPILGRIVAGEKFVESLSLHVINLDRRDDRLTTFLRNFSECAGEQFVDQIERFSAIDGASLEGSKELLHIFRGSELPLRANQTATALSHLALWHEVAHGNGGAALIFEDDAVPDRDFMARLIEVAGQLVEMSWGGDILFLDLAYFDDADRPTPFHQSISHLDISKLMGGTSAYIINQRGAQKLLHIAKEEGIAYGIDTFILMNAHRVSCLQTTPSLTRAPVARRGQAIIDSDIQYSTTTL
jgi:GR25 family glycosyltransferase involved in LPS biosynthesis/glycosyltransferase involved in cell wall biosynthesis